MLLEPRSSSTHAPPTPALPRVSARLSPPTSAPHARGINPVHASGHIQHHNTKLCRTQTIRTLHLRLHPKSYWRWPAHSRDRRRAEANDEMTRLDYTPGTSDNESTAMEPVCAAGSLAVKERRWCRTGRLVYDRRLGLTYNDSPEGDSDASISSRICNTYLENGRKYPSLKAGEYWGPSDEKQVHTPTLFNHHSPAPQRIDLPARNSH